MTPFLDVIFNRLKDVGHRSRLTINHHEYVVVD
jgi:hypothetical protein